MSALYLALDTALSRFGWVDRAAHVRIASLWVVATIAAAVLLVRLPTIAFSYLNVDEAVYTLIGTGLKTGQIPYVDIVDRKPIGLFLIYAFAESFFRDGVIGPRILASIATVLSGFGLYRFAERFLGIAQGAAIGGAVLFSTYGVLFGGDAAQAPVFYMPLVIAAAYLVASNVERIVTGEIVQPYVIGAAGLMLGVALQIKPSMVFECVGFGCTLIAVGLLRRRTMSPRAQVALVRGLVCMIAGGLLPTVIAGAAYAVLGHFDAWIFYNFTVNFLREESDYARGAIVMRAAQFALCFTPLCILAVAYARNAIATPQHARGGEARRWTHVLLAVWLVCALAGGLALRQPYGHYFYGVLGPLAILAGAGLHRRDGVFLSLGGFAALVGVLALACGAYAYGWRHEINKNGTPYLAYRMADDINRLDARSLYVFNQFGILYHLTGEPLPTKYPMPNHLLRELEAKSFRFDGKAEVERILGDRPDTIVAMRPFTAMTAPDRVALLEETLNASYCVWRTYPAGEHTVSVYRSTGPGGRGAGESCQNSDLMLADSGMDRRE